MASIFQRGDSRFWWASFKSPAGKWLCRSTKTTNQSEARRLAFLWEGAGATLSLDTPAGAQLDKVVRQLFEQFTGRRIEPTPLRKYVENWRQSLATKRRAAKTVERYRVPTDDFLKFLGARADHDIRSIARADVQAFVDAESAAGKSATTVVLNAKVLGAVFKAAAMEGLIEKNPAAMLNLPEFIQTERQPFTAGELDALLVAAGDSDWQTAILLGAFAGMRIGDAAALKWESVNLADGLIRFMPQKTARKKRELVVPIHGRLRERLEQIAGRKQAQAQPFVCPTLAGREVGGRAGLSAEFIGDIMHRAGIELKRHEATGRGHKMPAKSFHSLRHFFVSGMANAGVSADVRRKLAGHADEKQTARYTHLEMKALRKAVGTIGRATK